MSALEINKSDNGVWTLTLNHPETKNALTGTGLIDELITAFDNVEEDKSCRVVIIQGANGVFSSGGNINEMARQTDPALLSNRLRYEYTEGIQRIPRVMHRVEVPIIAAIDGAAIGAGLDLACMCDMRIASEKARFAESFVKLGIVPGDGGAWFLQRIIGMSRAAEMTYTGDIISAQTALDWGLVSRVVPSEQLLQEAQLLANKIAANPASAMRMSKRLLREAQMNSLETVLELSAAFQAIAHKTQEHKDAVDTFLNKKR